MATSLSLEAKRQIQQQGFGLAAEIGGQPKTRYWTPDGRMILSAPSLREFVRRDDKGNVVETGTRDANLDKGWLLAKPEKLQLFCPHCDLWHKTQKEIGTCETRRQAQRRAIEARARKELKQETKEDDSRLKAVESDIADIKAMLKKLVGGK